MDRNALIFKCINQSIVFGVRVSVRLLDRPFGNPNGRRGKADALRGGFRIENGEYRFCIAVSSCYIEMPSREPALIQPIWTDFSQ